MIKEKLKQAGAAASKFNAKPPTWAYWVFGIGVILLIKLIQVSLFR